MPSDISPNPSSAKNNDPAVVEIAVDDFVLDSTPETTDSILADAEEQTEEVVVQPTDEIIEETSAENNESGTSSLWLKIGVPVVAVAVAGAALFTLKSADPETPVANDQPAAAAPANPGETTTSDPISQENNDSSGSIITGGPPEYLPVLKLTERSTFDSVSIEEMLVGHSPPKNRRDIEEITKNWAYNLSLYENLGFGENDTIETLFADTESPLWGNNINEFGDSSEEISEFRLFEERSDYWASYSFNIESFKIYSNDTFTVDGALIVDVTNGDRTVENSLFVFRYSSFTINDKSYSGWQASQDTP